MIALTGDVAESGQPCEYRMATVFLEALAAEGQVPWSNIAIVPGNHDVDWIALKLTCPPPKDGAFDRAKCAGTIEKMQSFKSWFESIYRKHGIEQSYEPGLPILFRAIKRGDVNVVGLDTCESLTYDVPGQDNRALISQKQLEKAVEHLRNAGQDRVKVVLLHHNPFPNPDEPRQSGLMDEQRVLRAMQASGVSLMLAGHMHRGRNIIHSTPGVDESMAAHTLLTGPCCMKYAQRVFSFGGEQDILPNRYQAISVNTQTGVTTIQLRRFSFERLSETGPLGAWTADTDLAYANENGHVDLLVPIPERQGEV